ncbi:Rab43 protein [Jimgerdemannia flammicorona]|uniref:Rab43 protein n=1 Tax=Jimgerdemannia flammicorona TaxID=994334 RepID=A0A433D6Z2_9FUNG|nr:Rab43 protein [Jimgerdemannia flammicorona]
MAHNEEKAQSMLYRFRLAQAAELGVVKQRERRPHLTSNVNNLGEAEKWRKQVISEVSRKVSKIQDAGLSDYQVHDLNDEINKLIHYWKIGLRMLDKEGRKRMQAVQARCAPKRTHFDMYRNVDMDYYGYRDEEDGALLEYEREREWEWAQRALAAGESEFVIVEEEVEEAEAMEVDTEEENPKKAGKKGKSKKAEEPAEEEAGVMTDKYVAHVAMPSQKEVEEYLVRRRRQQLLDKYVSQDLEESAKEMRELTGMS